MSRLRRADVRVLTTELSTVPLNATASRVETFAARVLGLSPVQRGDYFPDPDTHGDAAFNISQMTRLREEWLVARNRIPPYVIARDALGCYFVSGLLTHLRTTGADPRVVNRLVHQSSFRLPIKWLGSEGQGTSGGVAR